MERAYNLDVKRRRALKQILYLRTVFAHNAYIIAPRFACPILFNVERAELAEAVGREQHLVLAVVCHHDLGPVYHGGENKRKLMGAERKRFAVFYDDLPALDVKILKKILYHRKRFLIRNYARFGVCRSEVCNVCRMVGLHVLDYEIIGSASVKRILEIVKPFVGKMSVYGVKNRDLLVDYNVRIIRHSVRNDVLPLKQIDVVIVHAYINNVLCDVHFLPPLVLLI